MAPTDINSNSYYSCKSCTGADPSNCTSCYGGSYLLGTACVSASNCTGKKNIY